MSEHSRQPDPPISDAVVVLATYDERENIERLIPQLLELEGPLRIIVVDDSSPDGTGETVEKMARASPGRIELLRRPAKLGYGSALVEGFERALALGAERVVSMDADFSHDPRAVPALLAGLASSDVVVGSRYTQGVRVLNWNVWRLLLSIAANRYVRFVLRLEVADCTSGFRAYRREALRRIALDGAASNGYAFLVEVLDRVVRAGLRVREVPIVFEERRVGRSKMDRRVFFEAVWKPWHLLLRRLLRGPQAPTRRS